MPLRQPPRSPTGTSGPASAAGGPLLTAMTWNVQNAAAERTVRQVAWLEADPARVVVLTEVGGDPARERLTRLLADAGFVVHAPAVPWQSRGVLLAVRGPTATVVADLICPSLPHRLVVASLECEGSVLGLAGVYVPSRGARSRKNVDKRTFQSALSGLLPDLVDRFGPTIPCIVLGDLNVVEPDHMPPRPVFGSWEYDFYRSFGQSGLIDAYRHLHPDQPDHSWFGRAGAGYRIDHAFCTAGHLGSVSGCDYDQQPRLTGLSDHAALRLTIRL